MTWHVLATLIAMTCGTHMGTCWRFHGLQTHSLGSFLGLGLNLRLHMTHQGSAPLCHPCMLQCSNALHWKNSGHMLPPKKNSKDLGAPKTPLKGLQSNVRLLTTSRIRHNARVRTCNALQATRHPPGPPPPPPLPRARHVGPLGVP